jgi:hypothetical protein
MDNNIYWNAGVGASASEVSFASAKLEDWHKRGHDLHSTIADPLFVAPGKHDFRLQRDSPAFKLGFKPIDLIQVGEREKIRKLVHDTD